MLSRKLQCAHSTLAGYGCFCSGNFKEIVWQHLTIEERVLFQQAKSSVALTTFCKPLATSQKRRKGSATTVSAYYAARRQYAPRALAAFEKLNATHAQPDYGDRLEHSQSLVRDISQLETEMREKLPLGCRKWQDMGEGETVWACERAIFSKEDSCEGGGRVYPQRLCAGGY